MFDQVGKEERAPLLFPYLVFKITDQKRKGK
jgi:hypothetical protein